MLMEKKPDIYVFRIPIILISYPNNLTIHVYYDSNTNVWCILQVLSLYKMFYSWTS